MKKAFAPPAVHFRGTGWARKERSVSKTRKPNSEAAESKEGSKPDTTSKDAD